MNGTNLRWYRRRDTAFATLDALAGLFLLGVIAVLLVGTIGKYNAAVAKLADARSATRTAETVLTNLQAGNVDLPPDARVTVDPVPDVEAPTGWAWVQVRMEQHDRTATLSGIVPVAVRDKLPRPTNGGGAQ